MAKTVDQSTAPTPLNRDLTGKALPELTTAEVEAVFGEAVAAAKTAHFAAGQPVTGERHGKIVREHPSGHVENLEELVETEDEAERDVA